MPSRPVDGLLFGFTHFFCRQFFADFLLILLLGSRHFRVACEPNPHIRGNQVGFNPYPFPVCLASFENSPRISQFSRPTQPFHTFNWIPCHTDAALVEQSQTVSTWREMTIGGVFAALPCFGVFFGG